jgi:hypothetical protein
LTVTTREEALKHLAVANDVRARRAHLKRSLAEGKVTLSDVFAAEGKAFLESMTLSALLKAIPGMGDHRVRRTLHRNHIAASTTLGHFPRHRRDQLLAWLAVTYPKLRIR